MSETLYTLLGVSEDADVETIQEAYREKVKDHHPDVSDEADAGETFKRLTDARDVLTDESRRAQYDRVGHQVFVDRYLQSNAWEQNGGAGKEPSSHTSSSRSTGGTSAGRSSASTDDSRTSRTGSRDSTRNSENAENYQRYRSDRASEHTDGNPFSSTNRRRRREQADEASWNRSREDDARSATSASSTTTENTTSASSSSANQSTRGRDPRADGWPGARGGSSGYHNRHRTTYTSDEALVSGLKSTLTQVGPWIVFHFVFLISAFVTTWLFLTYALRSSSFSFPVLFIAFLVLAAAVFFSILHLISRVYS